jgi:hypothetical protein
MPQVVVTAAAMNELQGQLLAKEEQLSLCEERLGMRVATIEASERVIRAA